LMYALLNSEGEKRFQELFQQARSSAISRNEFTQQIIKQEFVAVIKTRDLLAKLTFRKRDVAQSRFYQQFLQCPASFEGFVEYTKRLSPPGGDLFRQYEAKYDALRKESRRSTTR